MDVCTGYAHVYDVGRVSVPQLKYGNWRLSVNLAFPSTLASVKGVKLRSAVCIAAHLLAESFDSMWEEF